MSVEFSPEAEEELSRLFGRYPSPRAALLAVLHLAQKQFGYISQEVEEYLAELLEVPPTAVREVVSFYTLLRTMPPGTHILRLCRNLSCHLRGGEKIQRHIKEKLGIRVGEMTADGKFTLLHSECLGACEMAPMMQLDEEYHGPLTVECVDEILEPLLGGC